MNRPLSVNPWRTPAICGMLLMLCSAAVRLYYYGDFWNGGYDALTVCALIILPLACNLLLPASIILFGKSNLWLTAIPVWLGCAFFIIKAMEFDWWHQVLCTLLYLLVGNLYTLTVLRVLRDLIFLKLVFALPLLFHIVQDIILIFTVGGTLRDYLLEISVLLIMLSLLFITQAMERRYL